MKIIVEKKNQYENYWQNWEHHRNRENVKRSRAAPGGEGPLTGEGRGRKGGGTRYRASCLGNSGERLVFLISSNPAIFESGQMGWRKKATRCLSGGCRWLIYRCPTTLVPTSLIWLCVGPVASGIDSSTHSVGIPCGSRWRSWLEPCECLMTLYLNCLHNSHSTLP